MAVQGENSELTGQTLNKDLQLKRCPHCGIAHPKISMIYQSANPFPRATPGPTFVWAVYACSACGSGILAQARPDKNAGLHPIIRIYPEARVANAALPEQARNYLSQAYETLHAPDAAAVMAGSAVDAMLKKLGYTAGSVYDRIDQALKDNKITTGMAEWAHWVRLGANRPRHADKDKPHISAEEAKQAVEFAEALGYFLFVLTDRISAGIGDATEAAGGK